MYNVLIMEKKLKLPLSVLFIVAVSIMILAVLFVPSADSRSKNGTVTTITDGWEREYPDGSTEAFDMFKKDMDAGTVTISHDFSTLPEEFPAIGFYNYYCAVDVYVGDELIYSYGTKDDLNNHTLLGNYYSIVTLLHKPGEHSKIKLVYTSNEKFTIYDIDFGTGAALEMNMIREYLPSIIIPIIAVLFFIYYLILKNKKHTAPLVKADMEWILIFITSLGLWQLLDSQLLMDIGFNAGTVCLFSFEIYMLLPVSLLLYMYYSCSKYKKADIVAADIAILNFFVINILYFSNICSFLISLPSTHICVAASMLIVLLQAIAEHRDNPCRKTSLLALGVTVFVLSSVIQYLLFFTDSSGSNSLIMQAGATVFILLQISNSFGEINSFIYQSNLKLQARNRLLEQTFGSFVPDEMAQALISSPEEMHFDGEMRELTVLSSDIRGFSELIPSMSAADAIDMLNHYLEAMTVVIRRHDGTIIEFIGDAILASFDIVTAGEKHADKAAFAAIDMQNCMDDINHWNTEHGYPTFEMGIGLHTGTAYVGYIGSKTRMKYDIIGQHINTVSRIESYSTGGQILISQSCKDALNISPVISGSITVLPKGSPTELTLYSLIGVGSPYNIKCQVTPDVTTALPSPVLVGFNIVEDKHCKDETYTAYISAASEKSAVMQTDYPLKLFDNIRINSQGILSCKIISKSQNGYLIRFTSIPKSYNAWGLLNNQKSGDNNE